MPAFNLSQESFASLALAIQAVAQYAPCAIMISLQLELLQPASETIFCLLQGKFYVALRQLPEVFPIFPAPWLLSAHLGLPAGVAGVEETGTTVNTAQGAVCGELQLTLPKGP